MHGDLPIFLPSEVIQNLTGSEWQGKVLGVLQDIWDFFVLGLNAIVGFVNLILTTITVPFTSVAYLPQIIGTGCLVFFGIAIIKSLR